LKHWRASLNRRNGMRGAVAPRDSTPQIGDKASRAHRPDSETARATSEDGPKTKAAGRETSNLKCATRSEASLQDGGTISFS